ncbi:MAG: serine/threonine-protein kinase [Phycisphaerales bacterium]|nr:serine/threonine-protein kinase [Phycisphaerales bacterium]
MDPTIRYTPGGSPQSPQSPSSGPPASDTSAMFASDREVESIGDYRIIRKLGEGGFGIVYLAQQTKPVKRKVALKVIKPGMDTAAVINRFEAERQALAILDHAGVAKVFDAGTTERGLPYFVMEYVQGVPITVHCDRHRLTIRDRINLMISVCEAVLHAHQKGIVHRDLKPNNILVEYEGKTMSPKVIDFGIAKSLNQPLTEKTIFTREGQMIGTPEYMSPEQAEMTTQDIDTRSDIYSLGVVLYQILTGSLPFEPDSLRSAGFNEIVRIIREESPAKPSTRFLDQRSKSQEKSDSVAVSRETDHRGLTKGLRGDLDWIVMKCLEKERSRRYDSASMLADDLRRYLHDEPVLAGPPSAMYRIRKFARRHRGLLAAAASVLVVLIAGVVVSTYFAVHEAHQRSLAISERDQKTELLDIQVDHNSDLSILLDTLIQRFDALDEAASLATLRVEHLESLLDRAQSNDHVLRVKLAHAFSELARSRWTRRNPSFDDWSGAEQSLDRSDAVLDELKAAGITSSEQHMHRARNHMLRGDHARHVLKDSDATRDHYASALESVQAAGAIDAQDLRVRTNHAIVLTGLGSIESRAGNDAESLKWYDQARVMRSSLVQDDPENPLLQRDLAVVLVRVAYMAGRTGDADRQQQYLDESMRIRKSLARRFPGQNRQLRDLASGHRALADAHVDQDRRSEAQQHFVQYIDLLEMLAWLNPSDARAASIDLARGQEAIGHLRWCGSTPDAMLEHYERYHDRLLEPRLAYVPDDESTRRLLIENNRARAELYMELGRLDEARSACSAAMVACEGSSSDACNAVLELKARLEAEARGG